ncbi:hypothetical protein D3C80_1760920 [compost metagenome]
MSSPGSATQKISERAVFIYSESPKERLQTEEGIKYLYGVLSKISHAGESAKNQGVARIERLVRTLIRRMLQLSFES